MSEHGYANPHANFGPLHYSYHADFPAVRGSVPLDEGEESSGSWPCPTGRAGDTTSRHSASSYVAVAVQCVYIGINPGTSKPMPMAARASITDYRGNVLLDTYIRPTHRITDYRSAETGLQVEHLQNAPTFQDVQRRVYELISGKVLVGHSLWLFLSVFRLKHPAIDTRDLALFLPLRRKLKCNTIVSLSILVHRFMGRNVGMDYEDPLEIARASIDLFRSCKDIFEDIVRSGAWPCELPPSSYADWFT